MEDQPTRETGPASSSLSGHLAGRESAAEQVVVYTDGACSGNPGPGGWAWVVPGGSFAAGFDVRTTNQRMELTATLEAVRAFDGPLLIVSDSTYVVHCFRDGWWEKWLRKGWVGSKREPVANREIWKRMYTMLRKENPGALIVGHTSENSCAPLLSFLDVWEPGEGNWFGQLRDNYLDVLPLDELRAEFRAQHFGGIPWWLPAWQRAAILEDKDVAVRREDGSVGMVSVEKTHHMLGIALLLDIYVWPITGTNYGAVRPLYAVQDEFGMGDVKFFGYWNNARLIAGQTEEIKASVYRKSRGGALIVVYNTARKARTAKLTVDWGRLKSDDPLRIFDAYTKEVVAVRGGALTLEVPRLNYRLLWVR